MTYAYLPQRALLALPGADTGHFLQGLISNDARRLAQANALYAALLTPQGKFLHDFFLLLWNGTVLLDGEAARLADLLARLKLYRLRSQVDIELREELTVAAMWGEALAAYEDEHVKIIADPRLPALGFRAIGSADAIAAFCAQRGIAPASAEAYDRHRLSLGVPDGSRDMIVDKSLLMECGFEALHGVDFNKGCYVGQEVTARSKFRGQVRKSFYCVTSDAPLPSAGTPIYAGDKIVGEMRSSQGAHGLAMLHIEAVHEACVPLQAEGKAVRASLPVWCAAGQPENAGMDEK